MWTPVGVGLGPEVSVGGGEVVGSGVGVLLGTGVIVGRGVALNKLRWTKRRVAATEEATTFGGGSLAGRLQLQSTKAVAMRITLEPRSLTG
jgi:hypothetical protein